MASSSESSIAEKPAFSVRLISSTPDGENIIGYCARVSSPQNQGKDATRLLKYCIDHGHWSPFEMSDMCVEIITSRAVSAQILRHKSFSFQEFSQRYAEVASVQHYKARRQNPENRQSSLDDLPEETKEWFNRAQEDIDDHSLKLYQEALERGIAKECARFLLPMASTTKIYMNGSVRSWIHYLQQRVAPECQEEHREIALAIQTIFKAQYPTIAAALWSS